MTKQNFFFIDARVENYQEFVAGLQETDSWVLLNADQDGLDQMVRALSGVKDLASIQIISHGAEASLLLGCTALNFKTVQNYQVQLAAIGASLARRGDIQLYGCDVAQGAKGEQFVQAIAQLTQADVAASKDQTGASAAGGNWALEFAVGQIDSRVNDTINRLGGAGTLAANSAPVFLLPGDGKVTLALGSGSDEANGMALQSDGKIVLAGFSIFASGLADFSLCRFNSDGSLDTGFGQQGKVFNDAGGLNDFAYSVALSTNQKILVVGHGYFESTGNTNPAVMSFNADGSKDTSFDGDGLVDVNVVGDDTARAIALQADGKIVVAATTNYVSSSADFALVRLNDNGSLDASFAGGGKAVSGIGSELDLATTIAVQTDGKLLLAGYAVNGVNSDFGVVRYNSNGSLDTTFNTTGRVVTSLVTGSDQASSMALQADGKILVAGHAYNGSNNDFALVRYNSNGSLDNSFNFNGKVITAFGSGEDKVNGIALQTDGKILLAGYTFNGSNYDFALARYNTNGSLDTTFGTSGKVSTGIGTASDIATSISVQPDGKILLAGTASINGNNDFALVRYNSDGSLDFGFDSAFTAVTSTPLAANFTENGSASLLLPSALISDLELKKAGTYAGATLTLSRQGGANSEDAFSHSGNLGVLTEGSGLNLAGTTIGLVTQNSGGVLRLSFNSNATQALLNGALQSIAYANTSDAPPSSVKIDWLFSDGNIGNQGSGGTLNATLTSSVNITSVNDAPTGSITITGTTTQGQTLTASNALADLDGIPTSGAGAMAYQWKAGGANIEGATSSTYTLTQAEVGKVITVTSSYIDLQGTAESVTSAASAVVANVNDSPTGGVSLGASNKDLVVLDFEGSNGSNSFGTGITALNGATISTSQKISGNSSAYFNGSGAALQFNMPELNIGAGDFAIDFYFKTDGTQNPWSVLISSAQEGGWGEISNGTARDGAIHFLNSVTVSGANVNDGAWHRVVAGQTGTQSYLLLDGVLQGKETSTATTHNFSDLIVGKLGGMWMALSDNSFKGWIDNLKVSTPAPSPTQGQTLTASNTLLDVDGVPTTGDGAIKYQWLADGVNISGATDTSFTLTQAQVGKTITVAASYTDQQGTAESVTSAATTAVTNINDAPTGSLTISGTATQGQTLTAANTLDDLDGLGPISYQWKADGVNIADATGATLTLAQAQVGKAITATASYADGFGYVESVSSSATSAVANINDSPTGVVTITGTATQGQTLTAANTLADIDGITESGVGAISYQWSAGGAAIANATGSTYVLTQAEVGKAISVTASYTDGFGQAESVTSTLNFSTLAAPIPIVTVVVPPASVSESGSANLTYTFTRTGDTGGALVVNIDLGGTASTADYTSNLLLASASQPIRAWTQLIGTPRSLATDRAYDLTTALDGSIYITGVTTGHLNDQNIGNYGGAFLIKYSPDGTKAWSKFLGREVVVPNALTTGLDGSIYVGGYTSISLDGQINSGGGDAFLIKVDPDGTTDWTKLLGTSTYDEALALTTGLDGSIFVTGKTMGSLDGQTNRGNTSDVFLTKYSTDGTKAWTKMVGSDGYDAGHALTAGLDGSIYVSGQAGDLFDGQINSGIHDVFLTKYSADGSKSWTKLLGSKGIDVAHALTTGLDGSIYVKGQAGDLFDGQLDGGGFLTKFSSDGTKAWTKMLGTTEYPTIFGPALGGSLGELTTGQDGSIYVSGAIRGSTNYDAYLIKYSPDGTKVWSKLLGADADAQARGLTKGLDGSIFMAGNVSGIPGFLHGQRINGGTDFFLTKFSVGSQITFEAGSSTANLVLTPTTDSVNEGIETAVVTVLAGTGYTLGSEYFAVGSIDDTAPTVTSFSVSISGTPTQGQVLTAANTLQDLDGTPAEGDGAIAYQWMADGVNISGATAATLTLTQAQVGKPISVTASYTDGFGQAESVTSDATSAVANINDLPTGTVTISGTTTQGQVLSAINNLADIDGLGEISYQWRADGADISDATTSTFTLTQEQVGKSITVTASYTDGFGYVESVSSSATANVGSIDLPVIDTSTLTGHIYDWKTHTLLSNVGVKLTQKSSLTSSETPLFELKGLALNAQGDASAELWVNFKEASGSLDLTLQFDNAIAGSFVQNTSALPSDWLFITEDDAGSLTLGGIGLTEASGSVKLGEVTFDLPTGMSAAQIKLLEGSIGNSSLTPHTVWLGGMGLNATTGEDGKYGFDLLDQGTYQLDFSKALTTAETGSAVNSADALAALKIAVGRNPNADPDGTGPQLAPVVSPYQFIAADANQDGRITSMDAMAILKMAVKNADAPAREWLFVSEDQDFWNEVTSSFTTTRSSVVWDKVLEVSSPLTTEQNLVAVLKGDVNGSWTPPEGSQDLDITMPTYFTDLAAKLGTNVNQWAVIG